MDLKQRIILISGIILITIICLSPINASELNTNTSMDNSDFPL